MPQLQVFAFLVSWLGACLRWVGLVPAGPRRRLSAANKLRKLSLACLPSVLVSTPKMFIRERHSQTAWSVVEASIRVTLSENRSQPTEWEEGTYSAPARFRVHG
jgi:hypothetical protein